MNNLQFIKRMLLKQIWVILFFGHLSNAQEGALIQADKLFSSLSYSDAIPKYESVLKHNPNNEEALRKLATCYRLNNNTKKSEEIYGKLFSSGKVIDQDVTYYAQALMSNGKYEKAKEVLTVSLSNAEKIKSYSKIKDQLESYFKDSAFVKIKRESDLNSDENDFAPTPFKKGVVFTSNRKRNQWISYQHDWTNKSFSHIYFSEQKEDKSFSKPKTFSKKISTKYNDGPIIFSADGKEMYFTRNNIEDGKVEKSNDQIIKLKIFSAPMQSDGKIENEKPFLYNSNEYNCAHPTLSADGNTLIFASDMPGTLGGMDLWVCTKKDGDFSKPVNLGSAINTSGTEIFPYLHSDGKLYYSSNGLDGLGGLDIFSALNMDGDWINTGNLNFPINSSADDFGFSLDKSGKRGFFSANRNTKNMDDDIYSFVNNKPIKKPYIIQVKDSIKQDLVTSKIKIRNIKTGEEFNSVNSKGTFSVNLLPNEEYEIIVSSEKYTTKQSKIIPNASNSNIDILLAKSQKNIEGFVYDKATKNPLVSAIVVVNKQQFTTDKKGYYKADFLNTPPPYEIGAIKKDYLSKLDYVTVDDIGNLESTTDIYLDRIEVNKSIKIDNIYFDLHKHTIRPDAAVELNKLVGILKDNPTIIIELSSHTDCRSSKDFNLSLSDKRAKASVAYIVSKGIDSKRITGKGYGESKLVNSCECEGNVVSSCSEEEHQANRRTEFKIIGFTK